MSLTEYRRKRQFGETREPEPGAALDPGRRPLFVVQLHHASRRHYDFRLQVGDALKSWAVPKGPSFNPKVRRMAVEVEDHPVNYAKFEGAIPKGHYGGGHVAQFDHGVWSTVGDPEEQLAKGHLRFELFGTKLKGSWHLVRSGKAARQPQWLLFKAEDEYVSDLEADDLLADVAVAPPEDVKRAGAGKAQKKNLTTLPPVKRGLKKKWSSIALGLPHAKKAIAPRKAFLPQLAKLGESPPRGEGWIHELKWDGYRILATIADGDVSLWSRNAIEWTAKIPEIRQAIQSLGLHSAALDGELIAGGGTKQDFNLLQSILSGQDQGTLVLALFDVLHVDGVDISESPLIRRKALLKELLGASPNHLAFSSHIEGDGDAAFRLANENYFEGIISKRADASYHPGRSDSWRKTKLLASDEFAVVGYTAPKGSRAGFGSLLLAKPDAAHGWVYAGRVGSGFSDTLMREVRTLVAHGGRKKPSVHVGTLDTDLRTATWFAPRFVVEVFYRGMGRQKLLRQSSLKAVRSDKSVDDLSNSDRDKPTHHPLKAAKNSPMAPRPKQAGQTSSALRALPALSSPTKILFPDIKATKQEVWNYYTAVTPYLLPEIAGRPLSIIRCPSGTGKACFFQKHHTAGLDLVSSVKLQEESGNSSDYLVVEDAAGLMELVQFNTLEFHPWGSHADQADTADRVVFDLDPGPEVPFSEVKKAAADIRKLLAHVELESFLRVSGGKGLHIVVPLNPGCDWDLTKRFAHGFAVALAASEPQRFLAKATKRLRTKRIFVDYLRNGRGATAVASYSLRGRPGAPVALPVAWGDLGKLERADGFGMREVPALLKRRRKDPWAGIDAVKQTLAKWAGKD